MDTLLFFHILAAMLLVGAVLTSAVTASAALAQNHTGCDRLREIAWRSGIAALGTAVLTIALGEGLAAVDETEATWLDISRGLAVFGLLLGSAALALLARAARSRPVLTRPVAFLSLALALIALATAFVMTAKPS